MNSKERKSVWELYNSSENFSCSLCRKTLDIDNCYQCPIYVSHFSND